MTRPSRSSRLQPPSWAAVAAVALGGALGASLRWLVSSWQSVDASHFPWTTFAINVAGSFLLALLPTITVVRRGPLLAPFFGPGLLGGFTTLSTYSEETRALLASGHVGLAMAYLLGTLAACLLVVAAADSVVRPRSRAHGRTEGGGR